MNREFGTGGRIGGLEAVVLELPDGARVRLRGDRFDGTADLIGWCQERPRSASAPECRSGSP